MTTTQNELALIDDELIPLSGCDIIELGCGAARLVGDSTGGA